MGQAFAMIAGGFDLSIGAITGLTSAVVAYAVLGFGLVPGIAIGILLGAVIGLTNGTLIARYRLPPFIVTLGMLSLCRGIAYIITGGLPVPISRLNFPHRWAVTSARCPGDDHRRNDRHHPLRVADQV
jgi:ribose/xylose/arabinose/galactoside ABC-type transport system permease subunit